MNAPVKLVLGAVATGCIVVGVAAQVGTLQLPGSGTSAPAGGGVEAQQAPASTSQATPSPSPEPTQAPEPSPVVEATSPKKKKHGDG
jgi:hypothetical protein